MPPVTAEFSYWSYGEFSKTAMAPRPEVDAEDIQRIAIRHAVNVEVHPASSTFFTPGTMGAQYRKMALKVTGDSADEVRGFVREVILTYGRPDEVPFGLSPGKRAGKAIVESLLKEYPGR